MPLNVYIPRPHDSVFVSRLKDSLDSNVIVTADPDVVPPEITDILVGGVPDPEHLRRLPHLKAFVIPFAGVPAKTREIMADYPEISVHNLHHNAIPTAELAVTLMLSARKCVTYYDRQLRHGDWRARYDEPTAGIVSGKTALVIGYGAIGRHIAKVCQGMGMKVWAVRRTVAESNDRDVHLLSLGKLKDALPKTDALLIAVPLTSDTEGMIGKTELSLLPDGATLVNIGRGPIVDEAALYDELASGRISAGIDVWYQYPKAVEERASTLPSRFDFERLDNVVMTPHLAGHSLDTERLRAEAMAVLLHALATGDFSYNRVDLARGY
jgi:phosphoglycerate dehydrogenase-like enzyme